MNKPLVSVIMSVYNGDEFLKESINSILVQSFTNFEFIIINDGSTDTSLKIIQEFKDVDPRITLIDRENKGLIDSLNECIRVARGEYLVRMDADDISHRDRIHKQLKFMKDNPDISVIGSYVESFGESISNSIWKLPAQDEALKARLLFTVPFCHPSVMYKKTIFNESDFKYEKKFLNAEDYGLWVRLSEKYKYGIVPEVLLKYRYVSTSVSRTSDNSDVNERKRILSSIYDRYLIKLGLCNTLEERQLHFNLTTTERIKSIELNLFEVIAYLSKISDRNKERQVFCPNALEGVLARKALLVFFHQIRKGDFSVLFGVFNRLFFKATFDLLRKRIV